MSSSNSHHNELYSGKTPGRGNAPSFLEYTTYPPSCLALILSYQAIFSLSLKTIFVVLPYCISLCCTCPVASSSRQCIPQDIEARSTLVITHIISCNCLLFPDELFAAHLRGTSIRDLYQVFLELLVCR